MFLILLRILSGFNDEFLINSFITLLEKLGNNSYKFPYYSFNIRNNCFIIKITKLL